MEMNVEMIDYANASECRDRKRTEATPRSGGRLLGLVVLTLGLLCVLQATLNISLRLIFYQTASCTEEKDQLQASYNNLTEERDQLLASKNNLTEERDQLLASNNNLTEERDQLLASNNNLAEERDHLKQDVQRLKERTRRLGEDIACPQGWRKFGCRCYYASTEWKTWEQSRQDCLSRGADLVVINSLEEQTFISGLYGADAWFWIGLTDIKRKGTWTWVDRTPLTTSYWMRRQPDNGGDCVAIYTPGPGLPGDWIDFKCSAVFKSMCEK